MTDKIFVDTNILVYAHDKGAGQKYQMASNRILQLWESNTGVISTQVLQEFYITLTKKIPQPLDRLTVRRIIKSYLSWDIIDNNADTLLHASEIEENHSISFWDSLIVAAAFSANSNIILTENLNHGQTIEGILIENPFKDRS